LRSQTQRFPAQRLDHLQPQTDRQALSSWRAGCHRFGWQLRWGGGLGRAQGWGEAGWLTGAESNQVELIARLAGLARRALSQRRRDNLLKSEHQWVWAESGAGFTGLWAAMSRWSTSIDPKATTGSVRIVSFDRFMAVVQAVISRSGDPPVSVGAADFGGNVGLQRGSDPRVHGGRRVVGRGARVQVAIQDPAALSLFSQLGLATGDRIAVTVRCLICRRGSPERVFRHQPPALDPGATPCSPRLLPHNLPGPLLEVVS